MRYQKNKVESRVDEVKELREMRGTKRKVIG